MRILVDENIPLLTVRALLAAGHELADVRGTEAEGTADPDLWVALQREQRMLITTDKGFSQYRDAPHHGMLIVRLRQPNRDKIHDRVMQAVSRFGPEEWPGLLVTMRDTVMSVYRPPLSP